MNPKEQIHEEKHTAKYLVDMMARFKVVEVVGDGA